MKRKMFLITDYFPYGSGESFVMTELQQLCRNYDVTVVPRYAGKGPARALPEGTDLWPVARAATLKEKLSFVLRFFLEKKGRREIAAIWKTGENRLQRWKKSLLSYASAELFWAAFRQQGGTANSEGSIYYSFWYTPAALALSFHRAELSGAKVVVRTNGYDLYNERSAGGRQPFKPTADEGLDMVVSSCQFGQSYYRQNFGFVAGVKYIYSALGCKDMGMPIRCDSTIFHLVSCSDAVAIKRIERIVEGLGLTDVPIRWTHIGDGEKLPELKLLAERVFQMKPNIQWEFIGSLSNEEVLEFYKRESVNGFITTSASEGGCPVSIQEAMSFGVPIIGTAVGGITEMLTDSDNILLSANPDGREVAAALEGMYAMAPERKAALRRFNRSRWEERYDAEANAHRLMAAMEDLWEES